MVRINILDTSAKSVRVDGRHSPAIQPAFLDTWVLQSSKKHFFMVTLNKDQVAFFTQLHQRRDRFSGIATVIDDISQTHDQITRCGLNRIEDGVERMHSSNVRGFSGLVLEPHA